VGRNYDDIIKSTSLDMLLLEDGADRDAAIEANRQGWSAERFRTQFLIGGVDKISERIQSLIDAGIEYVITYIPRVAYDHTPMLRYAREVLPQFV
jgi:alkanesulfonate monooxygenase SsuD/methylene tetrahydromethanopterin reductase-like flavin-dependent oxidoreductase (luciferase family)